jgi:hypothetical protein
VPEQLVGRAFRGGDAVDAGLLTADQLRGRAWVRLLRGVYVSRGHEHEPSVRVAAAALAAPSDVLCGRTAAWLHGVWQPRPGTAVPLEVTRPVRAHGTQVQGATRRRLVLRGTPDLVRTPSGLSALDSDVVLVAGVRATSPLRTAFDLIRERGLVEGVVVADAFTHAGLVDVDDLETYCADRGRWPHVRRARVAVSLAHGGAMSPGETRLRMVVVLAGFCEPLVNVPVVDAQGRHLGTPDLQVLGRRVARLEYDGGYHEDVEQRRHDLRRENRLVSSGGVPVLRYDRRHVLAERGRIVHELSSATDERPGAELDDDDFRRPPPRLAW